MRENPAANLDDNATGVIEVTILIRFQLPNPLAAQAEELSSAMPPAQATGLLVKRLNDSREELLYPFAGQGRDHMNFLVVDRLPE